MASISSPCPKCPHILRNTASRSIMVMSLARVSLQGYNQRKFFVLKAKAQQATVEGSSNSSLLATIKPETPSQKDNNAKSEDESNVQPSLPDSEISAFMEEVSNLVKLVDSRDITELELKRKDCELIIRKKEALQQPASASPIATVQPADAMFLAQPQVPPTIPTLSSSSPAPAAALPQLKGSKSSLPPLKCPMAGTFYRSPAPGEPPFVKVGDKVKKGQVVCIIEAMKLMNEIEADQSGTVVDILVEDGKPVSVDMPLLIIEP
ncbi:Biotin carboxyl carrier protein of acetyl-CoA carboxylase 2, chloroplastic [Apostasia shenzhenica]|uniref:Biotin carboxyl carrier protein of acetyl-CoA carboxylase n=1 Tax=Apostasia shenzhenica TaxID=1088818 RepID=A0A2I0ADP7_9ASPA|nr:Biotin carboxyl carrier protein of acetyl-CoA carboxylase 2, chloroplastic [Apostasia shenzhenica]